MVKNVWVRRGVEREWKKVHLKVTNSYLLREVKLTWSPNSTWIINNQFNLCLYVFDIFSPYLERFFSTFYFLIFTATMRLFKNERRWKKDHRQAKLKYYDYLFLLFVLHFLLLLFILIQGKKTRSQLHNTCTFTNYTINLTNDS